MKELPKADTANIVQQSLAEELLLYNLLTNKALCLNKTSAEIYNLCNGSNSVDLIADKTKIPKEIVKVAISDLSKHNLLIQKIELQTSRRSLLKSVALSTMALPVISVLTAPTAAQSISITECVGGTAPGGFNIGTFPSDIQRGLTACISPACTTCLSGTYSTSGANASICDNSECSTVTCYCAPVGVVGFRDDR